MMNERFSDEMLMRFADGELEAEEMELVEKAMESDDDLVARVAMFIETKAQAQAALKPLLEEPVPAELQASVEAMIAARRVSEAPVEEASSVVQFEARPRARTGAAPRWSLPLAASVAAVIGGLAGYWAGGDRAVPLNTPTLAGGVDRTLQGALASVAAGQEISLADGARFRAIASFRGAADELCREFELDSAEGSTIVSVACHAENDWRVNFMVAAAGGSDGYAPASSTDALDAYLSAVEAGEPLSAEDEAAALSALEGR